MEIMTGLKLFDSLRVESLTILRNFLSGLFPVPHAFTNMDKAMEHQWHIKLLQCIYNQSMNLFENQVSVDIQPVDDKGLVKAQFLLL